MRYENETHLEREKRAIEKFTSMFNLTYKKLGHHDIDFQVFKNGELKGFVEVKGRHQNINDAYPLPVAIRKLAKLQGEYGPRLEPMIIWACHDGIIYGKLMKLKGSIQEGGRLPRPESTNDQELMAYYTSQEHLHHEEY
tara:strand:- start:10051 stop:10467 length:417 start_codon:yes stop_codon:yes gene_type:complete